MANGPAAAFAASPHRPIRLTTNAGQRRSERDQNHGTAIEGRGPSSESLGRYVAPDYVQDVDGKRLDFAEFIDHARVVKRSLRRARATIENFIALLEPFGRSAR